MSSVRSENERPRIVLICHENDRIDSLGLAAWLDSTMNLVGIVLIRERPLRSLVKVRNEIRRVGLVRFLDVLAFRLYYHFYFGKRDAAWAEAELIKLRSRYSGGYLGAEKILVNDPNEAETRAFLRRLRPDLVIARCKFILKREIFEIPSGGTYVLHPGICPEYRNAHGCFWALVNRDPSRIGMTLLRVDSGVDTGEVLLQSSYNFDEQNESPIVMQYRVVLENLEPIGDCLIAAWRGQIEPLTVAHRESATWGQPWLTSYLKWRRAAHAEAKL